MYRDRGDDMLDEFPVIHIEAPDEVMRLKLLSAIALIAETAFRRGFHHGVEAEKEGTVTKPGHELRYDVPLALSPDPRNGKGGFTSIERLEIEHGDWLRQAGLIPKRGRK
jgi:hypothetical protein